MKKIQILIITLFISFISTMNISAFEINKDEIKQYAKDNAIESFEIGDNQKTKEVYNMILKRKNFEKELEKYNSIYVKKHKEILDLPRKLNISGISEKFGGYDYRFNKIEEKIEDYKAGIRSIEAYCEGQENMMCFFNKNGVEDSYKQFENFMNGDVKRVINEAEKYHEYTVKYKNYFEKKYGKVFKKIPSERMAKIRSIIKKYMIKVTNKDLSTPLSKDTIKKAGLYRGLLWAISDY